MLKKVLMMAVASTVMAANSAGVSVREIMRRAEAGTQLNVVFFGGSLTWGAGSSDPNVTSWRGETMKKLREMYPKTSWYFKDSAIGGTGSSLGVFRMERDVFRHAPDLVLLDFTLNDNLSGSDKGMSDAKNHSYEKIIRECVRRRVAVLPVFTVAKRHAEMRDISELKRRLEHIAICKHYNLEYADILGLMNRDVLSGKRDTEKYWPAEVFDVTHPHDAGYAAYAELFFEEWQRIKNSPEKEPVLPEKFLSGTTYNNILRVELSEQNLKDWQICYPCNTSDCFDWLTSRYVDKVVMRSNADRLGRSNWQLNGKKLEPFTFKIKAEQVAVLIETVPMSVPFSVSVDGKEPTPVKVREVLSSQLHFVQLAANLEPDKWHTITVIPENRTTPGVMRWGAVLLNSRSEVQFTAL